MTSIGSRHLFETGIMKPIRSSLPRRFKLYRLRGMNIAVRLWRRGFLQGLLLVPGILLPLYGSTFAFQRTPIDHFLRGHWNDGIEWNVATNISSIAAMVAVIVALLLLEDSVLRWLRSWRNENLTPQDLFWRGLFCGALLYFGLRQIGSAMDSCLPDAQAPMWLSQLRMVLFLSCGFWGIRSSVSDARGTPLPHGNRWAFFAWIAAIVAMAVSLTWVAPAWEQVHLLTKARDGSFKDYALFLAAFPDSRRVRDVPQLAWESLLDAPSLERIEEYLQVTDGWGIHLDSARSLKTSKYRELARSGIAAKFSQSPALDKIWKRWAVEAGAAGAPRPLRVSVMVDADSLGHLLNELRHRDNNPNCSDPDMVAPFGDADGAEYLFLTSLDEISQGWTGALLPHEGLSIDTSRPTDIAVRLRPFAITSRRDRCGSLVGYRWTIVTAPGKVDSVTTHLVTCDTVVSLGGSCPDNADYDQSDALVRRRDAEHSRRDETKNAKWLTDALCAAWRIPR